MKNIFGTASLLVLLVTIGIGQEQTRDQKIQTIFDLRSQISTVERDIMQPDLKDLALAQKQGVNVMRLLPRETYDGTLAIRGGGAYYSFSRRTNEYGYGSDIELSRGNLGVGFAGADYGFIVDLYNTALANVTPQIREVNFLMEYKPPTLMSDVRKEQSKAFDYATEFGKISSHVPAMVGHTYVVRSISFERSDMLAALNIARRDSDGSLIIQWRLLADFGKPTIEREVVKTN